MSIKVVEENILLKENGGSCFSDVNRNVGVSVDGRLLLPNMTPCPPIVWTDLYSSSMIRGVSR